MEKPDKTMFLLQTLISSLTKVERNHHILDSEKAENDVEHSYSVALLCWYLHDKLDLSLDLSKIIKYALIHDFVEVYAGDVNTYASDKAREEKVENERRALERLEGELGDFLDMKNLLRAYEEKKDEEAIFVWSVDKMQSLILADLDGWRPYKKVGISFDRFKAKHNEQLGACSVYLKEIFDELLQYCITTYFDSPEVKVKK